MTTQLALQLCQHNTAEVIAEHDNIAIHRCTWGCDELMSMERDDNGVWHRSDLLDHWHFAGWYFIDGAFRQARWPHGCMSLSDALNKRTG